MSLQAAAAELLKAAQTMAQAGDAVTEELVAANDKGALWLMGLGRVYFVAAVVRAAARYYQVDFREMEFVEAGRAVDVAWAGVYCVLCSSCALKAVLWIMFA